MKRWQISEAECLEYLNQKFSDSEYVFEPVGGSDSTKSDILLTKNKEELFYIEVKMKKAQCGQFVVNKNESGFINSDKPIEREIIDEMNKNFNYFSLPGTKGVDLNLDKKYYYNWVLNHYKTKNVRYFIVEDKVGENRINHSNFIVFPIDRFCEYFDITAKYRVKKSGSSSPSYNLKKDIEDILNKNNINYSDLCFNNNKAFVTILDKDVKFKLKSLSYEYQFNPQENKKFEIRKLSNTKNANVIFSICFKKC